MRDYPTKQKEKNKEEENCAAWMFQCGPLDLQA